MRQVPNNQEVFLSPTSDTAAIVEILTLVTEDGADTDLWDAAKYVDRSPSPHLHLC
jgi:hypothetical protein